LKSGTFVVFYRRDTGIALDDDGDEVRLLSPDGTMIEAVTFGRLDPDISLSRGEDGMWYDNWPPTPGASNLPPVNLPPVPRFDEPARPVPEARPSASLLRGLMHMITGK